MGVEAPWYIELREQWRPERVRLLVIAESPPASGDDGGQRRFFYHDYLGYDNLFRGVVQAMYGVQAPELLATGKRPWLQRLKDDGFLLIDLAPHPVNALSNPERRKVLRESVPGCVDRAAALDPEGIVVVKTNLFPLLEGPLRRAGLALLHDHPIVFPLGNVRAEFIHTFNQARQRLT